MPETSETIIALATAPGRGGIAVLRLSGPLSRLALESLTRQPCPSPRLATRRRFFDPRDNELLDDGLVLWFPGPQSFTGEDVVELHCHGGLAVTNSLLEALLSLEGIRLAEAGEFSRRAFHAGKFDLTQVEAIADLVDAETRAQHRQALRQMEGGLKILYEGWRQDLIKVCAFLEAYIDFPEEDIPETAQNDLDHRLESLVQQIEQHLRDGQRGERLRSGLHVVILGAPNAGKSSLVNALVQREAVIVSPVAGTTRDIVELHLDVAGYPVVLADTAGLRETDDAIESEGIRRALCRAEQADLKIAVFDTTSWPDFDQETLEQIDDNTLVVLNKCDLERAPTVETVWGVEPVRLSLKSRDGFEDFISMFEQAVRDRLQTHGAAPFTRARHRHALEQSLEALRQAQRASEIELKAEDLRLAGRCLGRITGKVDVEDLLDVIFSEFCIGK